MRPTNYHTHPPILTMIALYGEQRGCTCRNCMHLNRYKHRSRTYIKCGLNRNTAGPATDWKASWPACRKYREQDT